MSEKKGDLDCLEITARVLIRCFIGSMLLVTVWFVAILAAHDCIYSLHTRWFSMTREQFDLIMYCLLGAAKIFGIFVFLIPYVCLRLVLRKRS